MLAHITRHAGREKVEATLKQISPDGSAAGADEVSPPILTIMYRLLGIATMSPMQADGRLWPPQQLDPAVQVRFSVLTRRIDDCEASANSATDRPKPATPVSTTDAVDALEEFRKASPGVRLASQLFSVGGVIKPALQVTNADDEDDGLAAKAKSARQGGDDEARRKATLERYKRLKAKIG